MILQLHIALVLLELVQVKYVICNSIRITLQGLLGKLWFESANVDPTSI